jgi:hypothetical protein
MINPSDTGACAANIRYCYQGILKHKPLRQKHRYEALYKSQDRDSPQWRLNLYINPFKLASINTCNRSACEYPSSAISQLTVSPFLAIVTEQF